MIHQYVRDIARKYLGRVQPSGPNNIMAICPFHRKKDGSPERTPSFALSITTGLWFCHSCKSSGNLRTLLTSFGVPPLLIDKQYDFILDELERAMRDRPTRKPMTAGVTQSTPLEESVLGLFHECPVALLEEGFKKRTLERFDVGFDKKNLRITFPIRDLLGRLVGFSGRAVTEEGQRYKVYKKDEYENWGIEPRDTDKSEYLWNAHQVYPVAFFQPNPEVFVVEGFKACMWLWQAGLVNTVALMGSHASKSQTTVLERMGGTVYLFLDNNEAGKTGTYKAGYELSKGMNVKVAIYEASQPSDLTEEEVLNAADKAIDFFRWVIGERHAV